MSHALSIIAPELMLTGVACILFLLGCSRRVQARRMAPVLALLALAVAIAVQATTYGSVVVPASSVVRFDAFALYLRVVSLCIAIILIFLSWPTDKQQTGNSALTLGQDAGEFFALFLLSVAGLLLTTTSNDLIVLFLALELVSIPTYIMVSMSRPTPVAQEAGVKYFFLGSMSVALMLFGFSYLYGATGSINLTEISAILHRGVAPGVAPVLSTWQLVGILLALLGFAFKMAAFPLHFYAGDVYEGAGTPVTAFLAYVPKAAGFVALIRLLAVVGGESFVVPAAITTLIAVVATITMFLGNVLALLQSNVKRVLAYSSIAHSGYMLVGVAAMTGAVTNTGAADNSARQAALMAVLFYLVGYGVMNAGAFGVLMLLPARNGRGAAETFDDIAGQGRRNVLLGLGMVISCFSLIGIPLTVGFLGKLMLIKPALQGHLTWLAIVLVINAAISAAYYLRIVAVMFLRTDGSELPALARPQMAVVVGVVLSAVGTLALGSIPPAADALSNYAADSRVMQNMVLPANMPKR